MSHYYQVFLEMHRLVLVLAIAVALTSADGETSASGSIANGCQLPKYPEHGKYVVNQVPSAQPGQIYENILLRYNCSHGYGIYGVNEIYCVKGVWSDSFPTCIRFCKLSSDRSVEYKCLQPGSSHGARACNEYEPVGVKVEPVCREPYYTEEVKTYMTCLSEGVWDHVSKCIPKCGTISPEAIPLNIDETQAEGKTGRLPWVAGIYTKKTTPYSQICGGALISEHVVLSVAHCFWSLNEVLPKEDYAVAVGKKYRAWEDPKDNMAQKSDVKEIHIPPSYTGASSNYQSNIAVVVLATAIVYQINIRPVCLSFELAFERMQLREGNLGTFGGWGGQKADGQLSKDLKVLDVPYVDVAECIRTSSMSFRPYITGDTFCAGFRNGTKIGKGDSGGGLVFPENDKGITKYFLRGLVSHGDISGDSIYTNGHVVFTQVSAHEYFIRQYL